MDSHIIRFLRREAKDFKGRSLIELLGKTNQQLERTRHVIKWMFPIDIPSENVSNPLHAPVLTDADIAIMRTDKDVKQSIRASLIRMTEFFESSDYWITQRNHNFKRISRILRCLWLAGLTHDYVCFQKALDDVYLDYPNIVGWETYLYWKNTNNNEFMKNPSKFLPGDWKIKKYEKWEPVNEEIPDDFVYI